MSLQRAVLAWIFVSVTFSLEALASKPSSIHASNRALRSAAPLIAFDAWKCGGTEEADRRKSYDSARRIYPKSMVGLNKCCVKVSECLEDPIYTLAHCQNVSCTCLVHALKDYIPLESSQEYLDECRRNTTVGCDLVPEEKEPEVSVTKDPMVLVFVCEGECRWSLGIAIGAMVLLFLLIIFVLYRACSRPSKLERVKSRFRENQLAEAYARGNTYQALPINHL